MIKKHILQVDAFSGKELNYYYEVDLFLFTVIIHVNKFTDNISIKYGRK